MIFLVLSIITATLFGISFKVIADKQINTFQAIIVNYFFASTLGFITTKSSITPINVFHQPWFIIAFGLGVVFICSLFIIAESISKQGISVAQVSTRMSVVIPISIAILFYKDQLTVTKIIGILLAISAVYLVSQKTSEHQTAKKRWWLLPLIIFICSGIIDSGVNYAQRTFLSDHNFDVFLSTIFGTAFILGFLYLLYQLIIQKHSFQLKSIPAGLIIGAINFCCMYFIMAALNANILEASVLFPINNLSVLILSTIISVLVFKEKLSPKNWLGIGISILAIVILGVIPQL